MQTENNIAALSPGREVQPASLTRRAGNQLDRAPVG